MRHRWKIMKIHFLLFLFGILHIWTQALHIDDGCEVNPEWKVDYKWTSISTGVWVPKVSLELNLPLLTIEIEIDGEEHPIAYDRLEIYNREIKFFQRREKQQNLDTSTNITELEADHWVNLILNMNSHHVLMHLDNDNEILFKKKIDGVPDKITMKGSNITVNCPSNSRVWNVNEGESVVIPLDDQDVHSFIFFSTENFTVDFELEKRPYSFGWHDGDLTMIPTKIEPLPQFEQHLMELECHKGSEIKCDIKIGEIRKISEDNILMSERPRSLLVMSKQGRFAVIMNGTITTSSSRIMPTPSPEAIPSAVVNWHAIYIPILAIFGITVIFLTVVIGKNRNIFRWSNNNNEENEEAMKRNTSNGTKEDDDKAEAKRPMIERVVTDSCPTNKILSKGLVHSNEKRNSGLSDVRQEI